MFNHFSCGKLHNFTNQLPMLFVSAMLGNNAINNVDIMGAIFSLYQFIADCLFKQCARDKQQIGRASCRERVVMADEGVAVSGKLRQLVEKSAVGWWMVDDTHDGMG